MPNPNDGREASGAWEKFWEVLVEQPLTVLAFILPVVACFAGGVILGGRSKGTSTPISIFGIRIHIPIDVKQICWGVFLLAIVALVNLIKPVSTALKNIFLEIPNAPSWLSMIIFDCLFVVILAGIVRVFLEGWGKFQDNRKQDLNAQDSFNSITSS